ncbi:MAG: sialidase [Halioglobus sp.]|nr:sialidase [Halioglobus sp.]|tara:strand:+ start:1174 stop:2289 length:1116 start_codon:yes stop_codon:yes gene_type:complete
MRGGFTATAFALLLLCVPTAGADYQFTPALQMRDVASSSLTDVTRAGDTLVAVGERGLIVRSFDDGNSWEQSPSPVSVTLTAVQFAGAEHGWAVGHAGTILHTADGGATWTLQFDGNEANRQFLAYAERQLERMQALVDELAAAGKEVPADTAYALEDAQFYVEDARAALETGPVDPMLDVLFTSTSEGWAVGAYGMIYQTLDGGSNWHLRADAIDNPDRYHYYSIAADGRAHLYLSGEAGLLYHSHDGGRSWTRNEDVYVGSLFGVAVRDGSVFSFGLRGNIFRSDDRGVTWSAVLNPSQISLYGGAVTEQGRLVMVGASGAVVSIDRQEALTTTIQPSRATLSSAIDTASGEVILVGLDGVEIEERGND